MTIVAHVNEESEEAVATIHSSEEVDKETEFRICKPTALLMLRSLTEKRGFSYHIRYGLKERIGRL